VSEVPIEPNLTPSPTGTLPVSAIENEIPTYRAISALAVLSLVCGILAVLSFAHPFFLISSAAAIVLGILADRKIRRLSDVLTGREIAQAGIALGLIFGLASITTASVQNWIVSREAAKFAKNYENVINTGSLEEANWYGKNPQVRSGKTPQELDAEIKKSAHNSFQLEGEQAALKKLKAEITAEGAKLRFVKIEQHGKEKMEVFAAALYELHHPAGKEHPGGEEFVLAVLKGWNANRKYDWWVENLAYPYQPASYKPTATPVDDGHGHAH
jgi:hypothetical protein